MRHRFTNEIRRPTPPAIFLCRALPRAGAQILYLNFPSCSEEAPPSSLPVLLEEETEAQGTRGLREPSTVGTREQTKMT